MAEPFKNLVNAEAVRRISTALQQAWPAFGAAAFEAEAEAGLEPLELKARVAHVASALRRALPPAWPEACAHLVAALPPGLPGEEGLTGGFWLWPVLQVVETHGLAHPQLSLDALQAMTSRFSAEFAVRPYLVAHPETAWATARRWAQDPNLHVRRLASEGTRPRLPWGLRLQASVADPQRGLAVIAALVDDPSPYVRRSVANHLGDVAKDHPALAVEVAAGWLAARRDREPLVRHALRDPLKKGLPAALALFGQAEAGLEVQHLALSASVAKPHDRVEMRATVVARAACTARVDVVWRWPGARPGTWSEKTFRGAVRQLRAGEAWPFRYALSLRPATTRPMRNGEQHVHLRVNGSLHGPARFTLEGAD